MAEGDVTATKKMTFLEYARWSRGRREAVWSIDVVGPELNLTGVPDLLEREIALAITRRGGERASLVPSPRINLAAQPWTVADRPLARPDIRRIREFDPRRLLGDLYTMMLRRIR
jgi:hypothetical protein